MLDLTSNLCSILELVRDEPWLTPQQVARWLARAESRVHADLHQLLSGRLIQRVNPRSASLPARAVYALSDKGVTALAE